MILREGVNARREADYKNDKINTIQQKLDGLPDGGSGGYPAHRVRYRTIHIYIYLFLYQPDVD